MVSIRKLWTGLFVVALAGSALAQSPLDEVQMKDGTVKKGNVKDEEYAGVVLLVKGASTTIPWQDVGTVVLSGAETLDDALKAKANDNLELAGTKLAETVANKKARAPVRQRALFEQAALFASVGKAQEAAAVCDALLAEFPKSRYLGEAARLSAWQRAGANDLPGALAAVDSATSKAKAAGVEDAFEGEMTVLRGRLLENAGQTKEALEAYSKAVLRSDLRPDVKAEAALGQANCQLLSGDKTGAEAAFREIVKSDAPSRVLAAAWNGLGEIVAEDGKAKRDPEKLLESLYHYLRGVVLYLPALGDPPQEHERSMGGAARCFQWLSDLEQDPATKKLYKQRADAGMAELKQLNPNSKYLSGN